ncbi:MAG: hypothetical protein ACE144_04335 [Thermodesulfobacteriota bacterium]
MASVAILLVIVGGYFFWQNHDQTRQSEAPSLPNPGPVLEAKETEKIQSLLERIREANLKKNIDLFMSCYTLDFKDRDKKKLDTLENWKKFDYLDLAYDLKEQAISGDSAHIRVEWRMKISQKGSGKPQDNRTVLDVVLKKEGEDWKIKDIQPIS